MRIEFAIEVERGGLIFGVYEVAAEFDRYQGPPLAIYVEGVRYIKGTVGKSIEREWVEAKGSPYLDGIGIEVLEYFKTRDGKQRIDEGWADHAASIEAERDEYRRATRRVVA